MASLRAADIRKSFGGTRVLKGIDLEIGETEFVALLGPSGCGKTTLLRIIAGLERQDSGSIHVGDRRVDDIGPAERDIALVFQSYALYPHLTVAENIGIPLVMRRLTPFQRVPVLGRLSGDAGRQRQQIARDIVEIARSMEIEGLLERKPGQLSGGQKQRVAVARALVRKPTILLMDEPLSNLDAKLRVQMRQEIVAMHRKHGGTTIYVTHDQTEAMTMADRIAVILNGELQQIGTPAEIYRQPATVEVAEFVGSPKINILPCIASAEGLTVLGVPCRGTSGLAPGETGVAGVRPEHVRVGLPGASSALRGRIANLEYLGAEALIQVRIDGGTQQVCVRTDIGVFEQVKHADWLELDLTSREILLFDRDGKRAGWTAAVAC